MKFISLALVLVGLCCFENNYAMENNKDSLAQKLSEANDFVEKAEDVFVAKQQFLPLAFFTSVKAANDYSNEQDAKAIDFANRAKDLVQSVLDDKTITSEVKCSAELSLQKIDLFTENMKK